MAPQGGIGGSVNVVTKRADDQPLTRITAEYLSNTNFGVLADVSRRYGDQKEFGVRINGTFNDGDTPVDRQWVRNGSLSLGLDYRGEKLRLFADVIYQNDWMQSASRGYTPVPGIQVPAAPNPRLNLAQLYDYARAQSITAAMRAEYDISPDTMVFGAFGTNFFDYDKREAPGATLLDYALAQHRRHRRSRRESRTRSRARPESGHASRPAPWATRSPSPPACSSRRRGSAKPPTTAT